MIRRASSKGAGAEAGNAFDGKGAEGHNLILLLI